MDYDDGRARVGDRVRLLQRVHDRAAPTLYTAEAGDVGTVMRCAYAGEIREWLVHVEFGMMVAVVNARCLAVAEKP
jgi:protein-disulfide isomerase-like protein with CxxC motif